MQTNASKSRASRLIGWIWIFCAVCITAMSLSLRVAGVWDKGFWRDEILTMNIHAPRMEHWNFTHRRALNDWLVYHISLHTGSEVCIRLPNIIASWLTVLLLGIWLKRASGRWQALAGMFCLGLATCFIQHTCLCRAYGMLSFFTILAAWAGWEWLRSPRRVAWLAAFFLGGAGIFLTRIEGIPLWAILAFTTALLACIRPPFSARRVGLIAAVITAGVALAFVAAYCAYRYGYVFSSANEPPPVSHASYAAFLHYTITACFRHISLESLFFSLHQNFRYAQWFIPVWLIIPAGLVWYFARDWRLAVLLTVWIIAGDTLVRWFTLDYYRIVFDSRHIQYTTPALLMLFVAGAFSLLSLARRAVLPPFPRRILFAAGIVWLGLCMGQYAYIIGNATRYYVRYERIADWKQIARLSRDARERGIPFYISQRFYDLSYFDSTFSTASPRSGLKSNPLVYYLPIPPLPAGTDSQFNEYDRIRIPYEPFPVYALYARKTSGTSYWQRACRVLDHALSLAPRHRQIEDALWAAWLFSGADDLSSLSNAPALRARLAAFQRHAKALPPPWSPGSWSALDGWGRVETWQSGKQYRWSSDYISTLLLPSYSTQLRALTLSVLPYYPPARSGQSITLWLGNYCLGSQTIAGDWQRMRFAVPFDLPPGERGLLLEYALPVSPRSLGRGDDNRMLALALSDITPEFYAPVPGNSLPVGLEQSAAWLSDHWSYPEQWPDGPAFRWLEGITGSVTWTTEKNLPAGTWELTVLPFVVSSQVQRMTVLQDSATLTNLFLAPAWRTYTITAPVSSNRNTCLKVIFNYARSPRNEGIGSDTRPLSAALATITRNGKE